MFKLTHVFKTSVVKMYNVTLSEQNKDLLSVLLNIRNVIWCSVICFGQNWIFNLFDHSKSFFFDNCVFSVWSKCSSKKKKRIRMKIDTQKWRILQMTPWTSCLHALFILDVTINSLVLQLRDFLTLETEIQSPDASFGVLFRFRLQATWWNNYHCFKFSNQNCIANCQTHYSVILSLKKLQMLPKLKSSIKGQICFFTTERI